MNYRTDAGPNLSIYWGISRNHQSHILGVARNETSSYDAIVLGVTG